MRFEPRGALSPAVNLQIGEGKIGGRRIRTFVDISQRVYSPSPLAARASLREGHFMPFFEGFRQLLLSGRVFTDVGGMQEKHRERTFLWDGAVSVNTPYRP